MRRPGAWGGNTEWGVLRGDGSAGNGAGVKRSGERPGYWPSVMSWAVVLAALESA